MGRTLMWLNLYGREAVRRKLKNSLKTQKIHFCLFVSYIGQPHNHIGWATSMPFASINTILIQGPIHKLFNWSINSNLKFIYFVAFSEYMNFTTISTNESFKISLYIKKRTNSWHCVQKWHPQNLSFMLLLLFWTQIG